MIFDPIGTESTILSSCVRRHAIYTRDRHKRENKVGTIICEGPRPTLVSNDEITMKILAFYVL